MAKHGAKLKNCKKHLARTQYRRRKKGSSRKTPPTDWSWAATRPTIVEK